MELLDSTMTIDGDLQLRSWNANSTYQVVLKSVTYRDIDGVYTRELDATTYYDGWDAKRAQFVYERTIKLLQGESDENE